MKREIALGAFATLMTLGAATHATAATAGTSGWYGGLQLSRSSLGLNGGNIDGALGNQGITSSTGIEKHDTTWGLSGGYGFTPNYSLEAGYANLGDYQYSAAATAPGADTIQGKFKAHAWSLAAVGTLPLNDKWSLFGKAELTRTTADLSAGSTTGATAPGGQSDSNTGLLIGAGATYDFSSTLFGKASWDRYTRVGDASTGKGDIDLLSLGVGMRF